jgi:hypothetical protein
LRRCGHACRRLCLAGRAPGGHIRHGTEVDRSPAVTRSTGAHQAALSLNVKQCIQNACMFEFRLTNTLPYEVMDIAFRFTAFLRGDVAYNQIIRNFSGLNPTDSQHREITVNGITRNEIERIEVADVRRCSKDNLSCFSAKPGDCIKRVEIRLPRVSRPGSPRGDVGDRLNPRGG